MYRLTVLQQPKTAEPRMAGYWFMIKDALWWHMYSQSDASVFEEGTLAPLIDGVKVYCVFQDSHYDQRVVYSIGKHVVRLGNSK